MKTFIILILCIGLLFSMSSCVVVAKSDNGKHKGWYKNPNNPHNPNSINPGKSNGKQKK